MTTTAHIHETSCAVEKTLDLLKQNATDELQVRAALIDLYVAGINQGKVEHERLVQTIRTKSAKALQEAIKAIEEIGAKA